MHHHGPGGGHGPGSGHWEERMKERQEMIQNIKEMKETIQTQINAVQSENEGYKNEIVALRKEIDELKKVIGRQNRQINDFEKEREIIRDYIPDDGVIGLLVSKGYGDVKFSVRGEEVEGVKSIICSKNSTLSTIINDEKAFNVIPIEERIHVESFKMLLSYYGYGKIILDDENVSNLLYCCLCYFEMNLGNKCKEYILNHLCVNLIIDLLKNVNPSLIENDSGEFKIKIESYIRENSVKLLSEAKSLSLPIDILDYINSICELVEQNDGFSLENISKYYNKTIKSLCEKKEERLLKKIKELSEILDEHYIKYDKMNEEEMKISVESDLQSFISNCNTLLFARSYLDEVLGSNEELNDLLCKLYSYDILPNELREEEKRVLKNSKELNEYLIKLMNKDNHGLKLSLLIIIDCDIKMELDEKTKFISENRLMSEYLESGKENDKILCSKCLCYFVDKNEIMNHIEMICGKEIIDRMKIYSTILPQNQKDIIQNY